MVTESIRVQNGSVGLHAEIDGPADAPPVIFVHGIASSAMNWSWLPDDVTRARRTIRLDLRGHGRSHRAPATYELSHYGSDVAAVLSACSRGPAVIVGRSVGGSVAWWLAQNHPELVKAVLLEDPALYVEDPSGSEAARAREIFTDLRARIAADREAGIPFEQAMRDIGARPWGPAGLPLAQFQHDDAVAAVAFGHSQVDLAVIDAMIDGTALAETDSVTEVTATVRIVAADPSLGGIFTSAHERRLALTHPEVEVIRMPGLGHGLHDLKAGRRIFCARLAAFLDEHASGKREHV